jgi:hypothetical protein
VRVAFRADSTEEQEAFLNARASPSTGSQDAHLVANAGRTSPRGNTEATEGTSGTTTTDTGSTTTSDTSSTSDPEPTTTSDNSSGTTS